MKKRVLILLALIAVFIVACSGRKVDENGSAAVKDATTTTVQTQNIGDSTVDGIGNDIDNAASTDDDLSGSNLGDIDSGLADIQTI